MSIDFSKFAENIQAKIKAALADDNKISAAEVRAMDLDKKVAIELMKELSGNPEFIGDGFVQIENKDTRLISLDNIENDTIIPLDDKARKHYSENYPDKDIKDGFYKDGKLFLLDSKGNPVKDDLGNYITEDVRVEEFKHKTPNFINDDGTINIAEFQNYLNALPESDEEYVSLMQDIEEASKEQSYWSITHDVGIQKERFLEIYQTINDGDYTRAAELMYSYFQNDCAAFDENFLSVVRSGLERLTGAKWAGPALYNALSYIAEHADNLMGRDKNGIGYAERFVIGLDNVGKGLGDFIFSTEGLIMMGAIATGEGLLLKFSSKLAPYVGAAIHSFFGAQGLCMVGEGAYNVAAGENRGEIAQGGQEIGHGLPLAIAPVARTIDVSVKISKNISRIKAANGLKELDDVLTDIFTKPMTPEERLNYSYESMLKRIELQKKNKANNAGKADDADSFSKAFAKDIEQFINNTDKELKEIIAEVDDKRAVEIALKEVNKYIENAESEVNTGFIKAKAVEFLKLYRTIQVRLKTLDADKAKDLRKDIEATLFSDQDLTLNFRIFIAKDVLRSRFLPTKHSKKMLYILRILDLETYCDITRPDEAVARAENLDLKKDIEKLDKTDQLIEKLTDKTRQKDAEKLYEKYLEEEDVSPKIKELCQKINNELGVKIILPSNTKEAGQALTLVYNELYNMKMNAEKQGKKANLPAVINFLTSNITFLMHGKRSAFYDRNENVVYLQGLKTDRVKRFFRHELIHANIRALKEFPEDFIKKEVPELLDDLLDAGLEQSDIINCLRNPSEFIATVADENINLSSKLKNTLIRLGMPEWILEVKSGTSRKPVPKEQRENIKNNILYLIKTHHAFEEKFGEVYYSDKPKDSESVLLIDYNKKLSIAENLLKECTSRSNKSLMSYSDRELIILCLNDSKLPLEENIKIAEKFIRKLQLVKMLGITISKCNDIGAFINPQDNVVTLIEKCDFKIKTDDPKVELRLTEYFTDSKKRASNWEIKLLLDWFEQQPQITEKYANIFPKLLAVIKDSSGKDKVVTVMDLFNTYNVRDLTEYDISFFSGKGSKSLQKLLEKNQKTNKQGQLMYDANGNPVYENGEFEKVEHLLFSGKDDVPQRIYFTMKKDITQNPPKTPKYEEAWKAIDYAFKHRLGIDKITGHSPWELIYTHQYIATELSKAAWFEHDKKGQPVKDSNGNDIPLALKDLYDNGNAVPIERFLSNSSIWTVNGLTLFKTIHSRARFLERVILKGKSTNLGDLNYNKVRSEIQDFTTTVEQYMTNKPMIEKYSNGDNPNIIMDYNGDSYRISFADDGSCKTIFPI